MKAVPIVGERGQDFTAADFSDAHTDSATADLAFGPDRDSCV